MISPGPAGRPSRDEPTTNERIDAVAEWLVNHAHIVERPGYQRGDSWVFEAWSQLNTARRERWRDKARSLLAALDRLSPSGEGEERKGADPGLHERGFGRGDEPGGSPSG